MLNKRRYTSVIALFFTVITICALLVVSIDIHAQKNNDFKVALLLPASITDGGWNALAYDGIIAIEKELEAKVSYVESRNPTDQEAHFRDYALDGYHLIFGHGFEYQDPAKLVAIDFPNTVFITSSGNTITNNISPMIFAVEEPIYLLGVLAGLMTKTNIVGTIGGQNIPALQSGFTAFEKGVKSVNSNAKVIHTYIGNWHDIGKCKELALAQINEGSDFIFPNADVAGLGAFQAAEMAQSQGKIVYTFGANRDKSHLSRTVIANMVITPKVFVEMAKSVMNKDFNPKPYFFTMKDDALTFVYNPKLKSKVPKSVQKAVSKAKAKIISGELRIQQTYLQ